VTPKFFGIRSNISPKLHELQTSNLVDGFVLGMPSRRTNNFPQSGRGLGDVTLTILAVRSAILATAWLLVAVGDDKKKGKERKGKGRYTKSQDVIIWLFVARTP